MLRKFMRLAIFSKNTAKSQSVAQHRHKPAGKWVKQGITLLLGLLIVFVVVGASYQHIGTRMDESRFPPSGRMVDAGGHRLHINDTGKGSPTVVLDAGFSSDSLAWSLVQPEVAKFTRVCSYDRAGLGWSEAGPQPRTSQQSVVELHTLLMNAGIPAPYILVGHSMGGINMQLFATNYPNDVAGVVLVDSSHADQISQGFPAPQTSMHHIQKALVPILSRFLLQRQQSSTPNADMSPQLAALQVEQKLISSHSHNMHAALDENYSMLVSLAQARATPMNLGDKPLVVLTHGKPATSSALPREKAEQRERVWMGLQKDLATRSRNSKHLVAQESDHLIQMHQPKLVVDAIRQTVNAATRKEPLSFSSAGERP